MPPSLIKRAAEFCSSPKFERVFDTFARWEEGEGGGSASWSRDRAFDNDRLKSPCFVK